MFCIYTITTDNLETTINIVEIHDIVTTDSARIQKIL
jgi:hypothetical protein